MKQEILRMERVCCREQGVTQLDGFNLSILAGEIVGLLPVNSHGLTTLLRLLQRNTPLHYGYVYYKERQINTWREFKKRNNRFGLIQSESCLVEGLTAADNIFVLRPGFRKWLLRPRIFREQLAPFLEGIGISIPADAYIEELTDFERVVVDVLKSVVAGCKLIVLRDISADICETELEKIHLLLKHYAKDGISFLYIDYHFEELQQICDKVALMSNGRIIKILQGESLTPESLYAYTGAYIGKVRQQIRLHELGKSKGGYLFQVRNTSGSLRGMINGLSFTDGHNRLEPEASSLRGMINGLSFTVAPGECVVLQNVDVQIFGELLALLSGETLPENGEILLDGKPAGFEMGGNIAVIQELPTKTMIFNELSYFDNLCFLLDRRLPEIWRDNSVREGVRREYAEILGHDIFDMRVDALSEAQKYDLIYARVVMQHPKVVFCVQPFRQADMELRMHIMDHMQMLLDKGMALVILAVNLADSLSLADKLIRIRRDKPEEVYLRNEFSTMPVNAPWIELYRESR